MNIRKHKIMKRILLSLIIMLTTASMHAQSDYVMLYLKDGTTLKMLLSESPNITYDKYNVNITTTAMSAQYAMTDIDKLSLGEYVPSGIENSRNNDAEIYYSGGKVELRGFSNGQSVDVYDTSGKCINHFSTSSDGALSIDVSSYSHGMYVIKTKGLTYKIMR